ncbi:glycosyl transferase family protein [Roseivivax marinus]|uniref:Glycosyl transferase family protein n=1 Tax=Roseivivax marinus TaxID=1379903 RepID=W4HIA5_9RHOB|nr:glycosyltransferase [Roseivivax marinus]ETW12419.1 glycosyl transferase family protein [Roseivivax marinus]
MEDPTVSVVVVSHGRLRSLAVTLTALARLDWNALEVVVVACSRGAEAARAHPEGRAAKILEYNAANISAARNRGIAAAAGEVVAFLDDDAVPEASWLRHLVAPFAVTEVDAAGGYVLGRNGISLQWGARTVDDTGVATPLALTGDAPVILHGTPRRAIKTEGTNMAVRRDVLATLGGFDPAYRFYLDETDLNLRLARAGHATALVPRAQVHHGFAESARRGPDRTPRDLTEIGASTAVFLRRHAEDDRHGPALDALRRHQRARLIGLLQRGPLDPSDMRRLMRGLEAGIAQGRTRPLAPLDPLPRPAQGFLSYPTRPGAPQVLLTGRRLAPLLDAARRRDRAGEVVTVLHMRPGTRAHHMRFDPSGVWVQSGGLFGRSDRTGPRIRITRRSTRVAAEIERLAPIRPLVRG